MIKEFQKEYRWLSNFYPCDVILDGITYPSVEHAYQSAKSNDPVWKSFCANTPSPGCVKKMSKTIKLTLDWEINKVSIMEQLINQKFDKEPFRTKLIGTTPQYIQEGNYWYDSFWGVDLKTNLGLNTLGNLIMRKRDKLNESNHSW